MGAKLLQGPRSARQRYRPKVGIISPVRLNRELLLTSLAQRLGVIPVDLLEGDRKSRRHPQPPEIVIVEVASKPLPELARRILRWSRSTRVVAFGVEENDEQILTLAEAGVAGLLLRNASLDELVSTIRHSLKNDLQYSPRVAAVLARRGGRSLAGRLANASNGDGLTPREQQVLTLIDQGHSNKEIAVTLFIAVGTVKSHVHSILEKVKVHRRGEAAAWVAGRIRKAD